MVENRRIGERCRTMSARNGSQLITAISPLKSLPLLTNIQNRNAEAKSKKIVLFDNRDDKDINDSSSSNSSEMKTNANCVSFRTSPRPSTSTRSSRSSVGNSTSSNGSLRPSRSASTPASARSLQGGLRSETDGARPRPLSRARANSRSSFVSSEGPFTPRNSSRNTKRKERLKQRCDSMDSLDSEDYYSPREAPIVQPPSPELIALTEQGKLAWDQFSTHVKMIDDSTDLISRRPRKTFTSSGIFQKAMEDLYGSPEYWRSRGIMKFQNRVGAIAKFASKFIVGARKVKAVHDSKGEENDEDDLFLDYEPSQETIENAQRGWKILRQYVQEMAAEKRMSQTTLSWDMLRHTIKGISNMERARRDLYQRYGLLPMVMTDGTVVQENTMLSERARSAMGSKPKPITPTRCSSSATTKKTTKSYAPISGFTGTGFKLDLYL